MEVKWKPATENLIYDLDKIVLKNVLTEVPLAIWV